MKRCNWRQATHFLKARHLRNLEKATASIPRCIGDWCETVTPAPDRESAWRCHDRDLVEASRERHPAWPRQTPAYRLIASGRPHVLSPHDMEKKAGIESLLSDGGRIARACLRKPRVGVERADHR
jgi:hypothetical protein